MSSKRTDTATKTTVVAIVCEENKLRAVELRKQGEMFEVLWTKHGKVSEMDLGTFAIECDVSLGHRPQGRIEDEKTVTVGFDSSGVVFYRLNVPSVREKEL